MLRTTFTLAMLSVMFGQAGAASAAEPAPRPNVILIITDDQGYGDLACHGNPVVKTPNLDRLFAESVRLTDFNVSPTCAPTRASLMAGRHEFRSGVTHTIQERERLALDATLYPQLLQQAGYKTGIFGKWHLGDEPAYQPDRRGFDEVFIHGAGGIGQSYPGSCGDAPGNTYFSPAILHNGRFEQTDGYCTDVFFRQALSWIEQVKPFYCHIATNAPHGPLDCPPEYVTPYAGQVPLPVQKFFGMITNIDDNVGRLMAKLKELKLDDKTLVIFMTDNGGTAGVKFFNAGMRGQKVTPYRGGVRVPSFWRWKGTLPEGVDVDRLTAHVDIFPTLVELAGAKIPPPVAAKLEGRSLLPLLKDRNAEWADRKLVTHVGRWQHGKAAESKLDDCAVRTARWRMVNTRNKPESWELYDQAADPGEKEDVAAKHPEVVRDLAAYYDTWWQETLPLLVNETVTPPAENAFKTLYVKQFGPLEKKR